MRIRLPFTLLILSAITLVSSACTTPSQTADSQQSTARESSQQYSIPRMPAKPLANYLGSPGSPGGVYIAEVREKLFQEQFDWLDKEAQNLRAGKVRMPGGYWKLRYFYTAVGDMDNVAGDLQWQEQLALLRKWASARPQSVTARVALAETLFNYGWVARGEGYANKVTDEGRRLFHERLAEAEEVLGDAGDLPSRCPDWYLTMLRIGQGMGWAPQHFDALFAEAVKFEPDYYYYYRVKASYLMPRWYGNPGDWERFAEESAQQVGGDRGRIIFFLIYSNMLTLEGPTVLNETREVWPQLLAGFRALEKQFGPSEEHLNEACLMAGAAGDKGVAVELLKRIGNKPDLSVWKSMDNFESFHDRLLNSADKV